MRSWWPWGRVERTDLGERVEPGAHVLAPFETPLGVRTLEGYVVQCLTDGRVLVGADVYWTENGSAHRDTIWSWAYPHEVTLL